MKPAEIITDLKRAAAAQGLTSGEPRKPQPGRPAITLIWLRPEPVLLRADPARDTLLLEAYLPYVMPGGRLHRAIKALLAERHPAALCISRNDALSIGVPATGDPAAGLPGLLAIASDLHAMLHAEWPDYARGVFAPVLI